MSSKVHEVSTTRLLATCIVMLVGGGGIGTAVTRQVVGPPADAREAKADAPKFEIRLASFETRMALVEQATAIEQNATNHWRASMEAAQQKQVDALALVNQQLATLNAGLSEMRRQMPRRYGGGGGDQP